MAKELAAVASSDPAYLFKMRRVNKPIYGPVIGSGEVYALMSASIVI